MPITALVRSSSGEVLKISPKGQPFDDADPTYFTILTDPLLPDGNQVRDTTGEDLGPLRVLGLAKILDSDTVTLRNATQPEIDDFADDQEDDEDEQDREQAQELADTHPQFSKMVSMIFRAINETRADAGLSRWTVAERRSRARAVRRRRDERDND